MFRGILTAVSFFTAETDGHLGVAEKIFKKGNNNDIKDCKVCPLFRRHWELRVGKTNQRREKSDETNMWLKQHAVCRTHFHPQRGNRWKGGIFCNVSGIPLLDLPHNCETFFFFLNPPFSFLPLAKKSSRRRSQFLSRFRP